MASELSLLTYSGERYYQKAESQMFVLTQSNDKYIYQEVEHSQCAWNLGIMQTLFQKLRMKTTAIYEIFTLSLSVLKNVNVCAINRTYWSVKHGQPVTVNRDVVVKKIQ